MDKFSEILSGNRGRLTKERLSLLQIVCDMQGHFHPYHVANLLKKQGYAVSLTTVYRNLSLLVQAGIISRSCIQEDAGKPGVWYEHTWDHEHHDHLICSSCGNKIEFSYPAIEILQEAVARDHGFTLESHHLELIGTCRECRNERKQNGSSARKGKIETAGTETR